MDVQIKDLLEAGVHFGHQTRRWNPKMKPYIFKEQSGIYIIDLKQTKEKLEEAYKMLVDLAAEGKTVIFVGTKRQAKESVREDAGRCGMYYIDERWLGGTLTNFKTIKLSLDRLENMDAMEKDGRIDQLSKKERLDLEKHKLKLLKVLSGIRGMNKMPSCIIVFDTKKENIAIREARKLNIPLIGLVDTNSDPDELDLAIPANDDAIRSIKLFTKTFSDAIIEGRAKYLKNKDFIKDGGKRAAAAGSPDKSPQVSGEKPKEKPAAAAPEEKEKPRENEHQDNTEQ
ncbi:MAG: 30S ribosomal protein S2 [Candidatus Krumholzibacteriota bacterium]|nr:30S ribosomal protein S2 [Candidatus Krumholzibacteriota bacterium]